jgi:hypothetical protein
VRRLAGIVSGWISSEAIELSYTCAYRRKVLGELTRRVGPIPTLIAIQQPRNLEVAYTLALLYEELGDNSSSQHYQPYSDSSARSSISTLHYAPHDALFYSDQHLCQCSSHYATSAEYSRACPAGPR